MVVGVLMREQPLQSCVLSTRVGFALGHGHVKLVGQFGVLDSAVVVQVDRVEERLSRATNITTRLGHIFVH